MTTGTFIDTIPREGPEDSQAPRGLTYNFKRSHVVQAGAFPPPLKGWATPADVSIGRDRNVASGPALWGRGCVMLHRAIGLWE